MSDFYLYAVTEDGPERILVPPNVKSPTDIYRGLQLGVYSSFRTFEHNKFLLLEAHLERTRSSMAELGWASTFDEDRLRAALHEVVTDFPSENAQVRFDILAEPAFELGSYHRMLITLTPFIPVPDVYYLDGVGIDYAPGLTREKPKAKRAGFALDRQRLLPVRDQDHYEYLILDQNKFILEGTMSNFWAAREGTIFTPGEGMLEGITRKIILMLLDDLNIPVKLEALRIDEVGFVDEAAVSGSSRAIVPVVRIARNVIGNGRPGPIFRRILQAYHEFVAKAIKPANIKA